MSFATHYKSKRLTEAKKAQTPSKPSLSNFEVPPPRAKFKEGDIVAVCIPQNYGDKTNEEYFNSYHSAFARKYMNAIGTVRLYYSNGYNAKFAVEMEDGEVVPISSTFLIGPFKSMEAAAKYRGRHGERVVTPNAQDLAGFEASSAIEVNEKVEDAFRRNLVNPEQNFVWLKEPVIIKYAKFHVYVLAYKKADRTHEYLNFVNNHQEYQRLDNPDRPEFKDCYLFVKIVDPLTNKLIKTAAISGVRGKSGRYFIHHPDKEKGKHTWREFKNGVIKKDNLFFIEFTNVPEKSCEKFFATIKNKFIQYQNSPDEVSGFEVFKQEHNIREFNGSLIVSPLKPNRENYIDLHQSQFGSEFYRIQNFVINEASCGVYYSGSSFDHPVTKDQMFLPNHIIGNHLRIYGTVESLEGLSKVTGSINTFQVQEAKTLEGFPEHLKLLKEVTVDYCHSLKGIPDQLNKHLLIRTLSSFEGARNCEVTDKGRVIIWRAPDDLRGFFKSKLKNVNIFNLNNEEIEKYLKIRELEEEFPEMEGIFAT